MIEPEGGSVPNAELHEREGADDLPGDPNVIGIRDDDGDGIDDDGFVAVRVDDQFACLTLPLSGDNIAMYAAAAVSPALIDGRDLR